MSRPRFSFRPNLQNEEHRKAWDILQSVPEGQRNTFIARAILENVRQDTLENTLRRVLREELRASPVQTEARQEDAHPPGNASFFGFPLMIPNCLGVAK